MQRITMRLGKIRCCVSLCTLIQRVTERGNNRFQLPKKGAKMTTIYWIIGVAVLAYAALVIAGAILSEREIHRQALAEWRERHARGSDQ